MREWGIVHRSEPGLHRGPMTEDEAYQWLAEWIEAGGNPASFFVVERQVGPWCLADSDVPFGSAA